jgi:proline iminopeptidase
MSRTIPVDGAEIHVEDVGRGPVALVLHGGLGIDHRMYRSLDPLGDALRLVYVDHRGNGRSTGDPDTATMEQWAADAAAVARHVAGDEPVVVIGHSYGGFIAQELMIAHPDVVRAGVLLTTTPGQLADGEEPASEGPAMPEEFAAMFIDMPETDEQYAAFTERLLPAYLHRTSVEALRTAMAGTVFRVAAMRRGFEELARWSSVDRLAEVTVPVLVVAGRHDAFCAWPQSERIANRLPDAEVVVFEESGHMPWLEEPDRFFPTVLDWLRRRGLLG